MTEKGVLFHAKHAFMPNNLGYCGPDENAKLLQGLEQWKSGEGLVGSLQRFEAAYPFLRLIARSSGRDVFDVAVPEAYWVGNGLLRRVPAADFYSFSHRVLRGKDQKRVREVFRELDGSALPHHTFYVMSTYAASVSPDGPNLANENQKKVVELMDNCRVSWGKVTRVGRKELRVAVSPVSLRGGTLRLARPIEKRVRYNPDVRPFGSVRPGDVVSLHWNYACEILSRRQQKNIARYTAEDLMAVNHLLAKSNAERR